MYGKQLTSILVFATAVLGAQARVKGPFEALEQRAGGRLGVMVLDTATGRTLAHRSHERFLMCSTFKLLLAAQVLRRVDEGRETMERVLPYGPTDLLEYAPVTAKHLEEKGMTVGALCEAMVTVSDNTAANLLLKAVGGPAAYTRFARSLGDTVTRLDRYEPALNYAVKGQHLDTTTPAAMLATLRKVVLGDALSPASRSRLEGWLRANTTGEHRLKAGLPPGWAIGDKTGTGGNNTTNDLGVLFPPGRAPVLVVAYFTGSKGSPAERDAVLAEVGRLAAAQNWCASVLPVRARVEARPALRVSATASK